MSASKPSLGRRLAGTMIRGLLVVAPIAVTIAILVWLVGLMDGLFGGWLAKLLDSPWIKAHTGGESLYRPGMGLVLGLVVVLVVGIFLDYWVVRGLINLADDLLERMPLVKSIYGSLRDLVGFFSATGQKQVQQVVVVKLAGDTVRFLALMTRDDLADLPGGAGGADLVAVYVPFSYAMGGMTILVPRAAVARVDMSVEQAMRFAVTAGMSGGTVSPPAPGSPGTPGVSPGSSPGARGSAPGTPGSVSGANAGGDAGGPRNR